MWTAIAALACGRLEHEVVASTDSDDADLHNIRQLVERIGRRMGSCTVLDREPANES